MNPMADFAEGLKVLDLGSGMSSALACKYFLDAGAKVTRIEPANGDPFYKVLPAYKIWQKNKDIKTWSDNINLDELLTDVDICLVGGESHPDLDWRFNADELAAKHGRLIVLEITGYPRGSGKEDMALNDFLAAAVSGLAYEHFSARPVSYSAPLASYGASLQGMAGILVALIERERSGKGQIVSTSLFQGCIDWLRTFWYVGEKASPYFNAMIPKDARMHIYKCADGKYIHFVMGTPGSVEGLYNTLGIEELDTVNVNERGIPTGRGDPKNFFGDIDTLREYVCKWNSEDLIKALNKVGLPAEPLKHPGECWDEPQVVENGIIMKDEAGNRYPGFPIKGL